MTSFYHQLVLVVPMQLSPKAVLTIGHQLQLPRVVYTWDLVHLVYIHTIMFPVEMHSLFVVSKILSSSADPPDFRDSSSNRPVRGYNKTFNGHSPSSFFPLEIFLNIHTLALISFTSLKFNATLQKTSAFLFP